MDLNDEEDATRSPDTKDEKRKSEKPREESGDNAANQDNEIESHSKEHFSPESKLLKENLDIHSPVCELSGSKHNIDSTILDVVDGIAPLSNRARSLTLLPSIEESVEDDEDTSLLPQNTLTSASSSSSSLSSSSCLLVGNTPIHGISSKPTLTSIIEEPMQTGTDDKDIEEAEDLIPDQSEGRTEIEDTEAKRNDHADNVSHIGTKEQEPQWLVEADNGSGDVRNERAFEVDSELINKQGILSGGEGNFDIQKKDKTDFDIFPVPDVIVNVAIQDQSGVSDGIGVTGDEDIGNVVSCEEKETENKESERKSSSTDRDPHKMVDDTMTPTQNDATSTGLDDGERFREGVEVDTKEDVALTLDAMAYDTMVVENVEFSHANFQSEQPKVNEQAPNSSEETVAQDQSDLTHQSLDDLKETEVLESENHTIMLSTEQCDNTKYIINKENTKDVEEVPTRIETLDTCMQDTAINEGQVIPEAQSVNEDDKKAKISCKAKGSGSDSKVTSSSCDVSGARESHSEHTISLSNSEKPDRDGGEKETPKQRDKDKDREGNKRKRERAMDEVSASSDVKECWESAVGDVHGKIVKSRCKSGPYGCEIRGSNIKTTCRLQCQMAVTPNGAQNQADMLPQNSTDMPHVERSSSHGSTTHDADSSVSDQSKPNKRLSKRKGKRRKKRSGASAVVEEKACSAPGPTSASAVVEEKACPAPGPTSAASIGEETDSLEMCDSTHGTDSSLSISHSDIPMSSDAGDQACKPLAVGGNCTLLSTEEPQFYQSANPSKIDPPGISVENSASESCGDGVGNIDRDGEKECPTNKTKTEQDVSEFQFQEPDASVSTCAMPNVSQRAHTLELFATTESASENSLCAPKAELNLGSAGDVISNLSYDNMQGALSVSENEKDVFPEKIRHAEYEQPIVQTDVKGRISPSFNEGNAKYDAEEAAKDVEESDNGIKSEEKICLIAEEPKLQEKQEVLNEAGTNENVIVEEEEDLLNDEIMSNEKSIEEQMGDGIDFETSANGMAIDEERKDLIQLDTGANKEGIEENRGGLIDVETRAKENNVEEKENGLIDHEIRTEEKISKDEDDLIDLETRTNENAPKEDMMNNELKIKENNVGEEETRKIDLETSTNENVIEEEKETMDDETKKGGDTNGEEETNQIHVETGGNEGVIIEKEENMIDDETKIKEKTIEEEETNLIDLEMGTNEEKIEEKKEDMVEDETKIMEKTIEEEETNLIDLEMGTNEEKIKEKKEDMMEDETEIMEKTMGEEGKDIIGLETGTNKQVIEEDEEDLIDLECNEKKDENLIDDKTRTNKKVAEEKEDSPSDNEIRTHKNANEDKGGELLEDDLEKYIIQLALGEQQPHHVTSCNLKTEVTHEEHLLFDHEEMVTPLEENNEQVRFLNMQEHENDDTPNIENSETLLLKEDFRELDAQEKSEQRSPIVVPRVEEMSSDTAEEDNGEGTGKDLKLNCEKAEDVDIGLGQNQGSELRDFGEKEKQHYSSADNQIEEDTGTDGIHNGSDENDGVVDFLSGSTLQSKDGKTNEGVKYEEQEKEGTEKVRRDQTKCLAEGSKDHVQEEGMKQEEISLECNEWKNGDKEKTDGEANGYRITIVKEENIEKQIQCTPEKAIAAENRPDVLSEMSFFAVEDEANSAITNLATERRHSSFHLPPPNNSEEFNSYRPRAFDHQEETLGGESLLFAVKDQINQMLDSVADLDRSRFVDDEADQYGYEYDSGGTSNDRLEIGPDSLETSFNKTRMAEPPTVNVEVMQHEAGAGFDQKSTDACVDEIITAQSFCNEDSKQDGCDNIAIDCSPPELPLNSIFVDDTIPNEVPQNSPQCFLEYGVNIHPPMHIVPNVIIQNTTDFENSWDQREIEVKFQSLFWDSQKSDKDDSEGELKLNEDTNLTNPIIQEQSGENETQQLVDLKITTTTDDGLELKYPLKRTEKSTDIFGDVTLAEKLESIEIICPSEGHEEKGDLKTESPGSVKTHPAVDDPSWIGYPMSPTDLHGETAEPDSTILEWENIPPSSTGECKTSMDSYQEKPDIGHAASGTPPFSEDKFDFEINVTVEENILQTTGESEKPICENVQHEPDNILSSNVPFVPLNFGKKRLLHSVDEDEEIEQADSQTGCFDSAWASLNEASHVKDDTIQRRKDKHSLDDVDDALSSPAEAEDIEGSSSTETERLSLCANHETILLSLENLPGPLEPCSGQNAQDIGTAPSDTEEDKPHEQQQDIQESHKGHNGDPPNSSGTKMERYVVNTEAALRDPIALSSNRAMLKHTPLWRKVIARIRYPRSIRKLSINPGKSSKSRPVAENWEAAEGLAAENELDSSDDGWKTLERDAQPPSASSGCLDSHTASEKSQWRRFRRLQRTRKGAEMIPCKLPPIRRTLASRNAQRFYATDPKEHFPGPNESKKGKTRKKRSDLLLHGHLKDAETSHQREASSEVFEVFCDQDRKEVSDLAGSLANKETPTVRLLMKPLIYGLNAQTSQEVRAESNMARQEGPSQLIDEAAQMKTRPSKRISCALM